MLKPVAPPPEAAIARVVQPFECPHCGGTIGAAEKLPAALLTHARCPHCTRSFLVPGQIDEFVLADRLKSGGSGNIYRARDTNRGCEVAVKFLPPAAIADADSLARLQQAVLTLAHLHNPHLAGVFDLRVIDGLPFLVLELVTGERMAARLESLHRIPERDALRMALDVTDGLAALHEAGLIHGNVTPASIMIGMDGAAKLANHGLLGSQRRDARGAVLGTPLFIATEVLGGGSDTPRSDIYSLGVTLYLLLTGKPPFEGDTMGALLKAQMLGVSFPVGAHVSTLSQPTRELVRRAMKRDPADRFADCRAFGSDIRAALAALSPEPPAVAPPLHAPPPVRREHRVRPHLLLGVVAAVALLVCGWALFGPDGLLVGHRTDTTAAAQQPGDLPSHGRAFGPASAEAVAVCTSPAKPAWQESSIGSASTRGSTFWGNAGVAVTGEGANIGGAEDNCRFLCATVGAPYIFSLCLTRLTAALPGAESGILARGSTAPAAPAVFFGCGPDGALGFKCRRQAGKTMETITTSPGEGWRTVSLRLECSADRFRASYSHDSTNWTVFGTCQAAIPLHGAKAGIAVASGATDAMATVEISDIRVLVPPPPTR